MSEPEDLARFNCYLFGDLAVELRKFGCCNSFQNSFPPTPVNLRGSMETTFDHEFVVGAVFERLRFGRPLEKCVAIDLYLENNAA